jgi:hypothetical protein
MMVMAPWFERERLLHAALRKATATLQSPIDRMEVTPGKILFWAGAKQLAIAYSYVSDSKTLGPAHFLLDGEDFHDDR